MSWRHSLERCHRLSPRPCSGTIGRKLWRGSSASIVDHINNSGRHLLGLVNDVFSTLRRSKAGKLKLDMSRPLDLIAVITECLGLLQPRIARPDVFELATSFS